MDAATYFPLSKLFWLLFSPGNLLFFGLVLGGALCVTRWRRIGQRLLATVIVLAGLIAVIPVGGWLVQNLEDRIPRPTLPAKVDGIIVLGGAVALGATRGRGEIALGGSVERIIAFARLAKKYPAARLVYTGGSGNLFDQRLKEADIVLPLLRELGIDLDVVLEARSRNSHENALFSRKLVGPKPGSSWLLITSARHMPRAVGTFRAAGWKIIPYPVDYLTPARGIGWFRLSFVGNLGALNAATKEWIGLIAYYLLGRSDSLFPSAPSTKSKK